MKRKTMINLLFGYCVAGSIAGMILAVWHVSLLLQGELNLSMLLHLYLIPSLIIAFLNMDKLMKTDLLSKGQSL